MLDARNRLLLSEMELQCAFALKGYEIAASALARRDREGFWSAVQAALSAAGHLQGFLEGEPGLSASLGVGEDSPLRRSALAEISRVPGAFFRWLSSHPRGPHRLTNLGPSGVSDADPELFARYIDVEQSLVVLFGHSFPIPALLSAIAELAEKVKEELQRTQNLV